MSNTDPNIMQRLGTAAGAGAAAVREGASGDLSGAGKAAGTAAGAAAGAASSVVPGASVLGNLPAVINTLSSPGLWKRIGVGALGVWFIYLGVIIILANTDAVRQGVKSVSAIATKGVVK